MSWKRDIPQRLGLTSGPANSPLDTPPSIFGREGRGSTLGGKVQTVMADILRVEREMQFSHKKATKNQYPTSDLTSRAARDIDLCSSVGMSVAEA